MNNISPIKADRRPSRNGKWPALERLEKWRVDSGLSQSDAAARAGLCVPVFNRILNGRTTASKAAGFAIERLTGGVVTAVELFLVIPIPAGRRNRRRIRR